MFAKSIRSKLSFPRLSLIMSLGFLNNYVLAIAMIDSNSLFNFYLIQLVCFLYTQLIARV